MKLGAYAAGLELAALPAETIITAKAALLYGLAVAIGTRKARPAQIAAKVTEPEIPAATRLLDGGRVSCATAAFANAVLMSGRAQGDSHLCGHLGGVVIPAALAMSEKLHADGATFLAAVVAGYEVALRIGRDHYADLSQRGFRTSPCYGVFGATVSSARVRRFTPEQTTNAINLSTNFAGGLREYVDGGSEESPFQAGFAARNGLYVADLVDCGVTASAGALSGSAGFYRAFGRKGVDYGQRLVEHLGVAFELGNVTYKEYPACQIVRGIINGLAALRQQAGSSHAERIVVRLTPYEANFIGTAFKGPFTSAAQTLMSAPFCAALAWTTGTVTYDALRIYEDPLVLGLVSIIDIIADNSRRKYEPHITVTLDSGNTLTWEPKRGAGDSAYQLTWEAAIRMNERLCTEVNVPMMLAERLAEEVEKIDRAPSIDGLIATVCAATGAAY